ncbi:MOSC domain-containing protein [Streptomyces boncukensis]|uniref:MOSC domain-containing protein n=1 Tax=Streptomyces boncukensis TaxID=2711219 RepID=A0A6G4X5I7_9ACTN|nr:MOSC N-terminal beta barrel domain-containing protein [Streptomyces boncukensis]NGO72785.1 MOSC domain-containing protein [Streptomyces boncukensis]
MIAVVELITYPVKGCAGVPSQEVRLTPAGPAHDRSFMVVSTDGVYRTQRAHPALATIRPRITEDGRELTLRAPGMPPLDLPVDTESAPGPVDLFGAAFRGIDQGREASKWLTAHLGADSRLVRVPPDHDRVTDGLHPGRSGYADSGAVHLLSRASLHDLNARIEAAGRAPLPMARFRPNIVVDGWEAPYTEDTLRRATVGDAELGFAKPAVRCAVTLVDPDTGTRAGPEPLRTLADYRRDLAPGGVTFGAKFSVLRPGTLRVGDELTATEYA